MPQPLSESQARRIALQEACRQFDLARGPLVRVILLRLASDDHLLVISVHHTVFDGWSSHIFSREFSAIYNAFSQGVPSVLPDLDLQYVDFAVWQRERLQKEWLQTLVSYWKNQLSNPSILELPTDFPRPAVYTYRGSRQSLILPAALARGIEKLSHDLGITKFMVMLAAFNAILSKKSGQKDIMIGAPIANRTSVELEDLIGCFVNTLVFRTDLSGDPTFAILCGRVKDMCRQAYAHQDLPFEKLVEEINPAREMSRNPLFQAVFNFNNTPTPFKITDDASPELETGMLNGGTAVFELTLTVDPVNPITKNTNEINCVLEYNTDLFEAATIRRMLGEFASLLDAVEANPDLRLSEFPLLSEQARHQLLVEWNDTAAEDEPCLQVHQQIEYQAQWRPDAVALRFGDAQLSYRELNRRANQLGHFLRARGVTGEDLIAICVPRSIEWVLAVLATIKAGAAYVSLDPEAPSERLQHMVESCRLTIADNDVEIAIRNSQIQIVSLSRDHHEISKQSDHNPQIKVHDAALAYVIYTSGSIGHPKPVGIEHRGLMNLVAWHRLEYSIASEDRATQVAQASFDASLWEMWPYLVSGACLEICDRDTRIDPEKLIDWMEQRQITISFLPTPLAETVIRRKWIAGAQFKRLLTGGDRLRQVACDGQSFDLINHYGPTENSVVTTSAIVDAQSQVLPPIGRPIMNTRVYVVGADWQPVTLGVPGELAIAGRGLARYYLAHPALTAEKFIPNPYGAPGERLYLSGDLVRYRNDGRIDFVGRLDTQVKIRGYRIELGEIEAALKSHPEVGESIVIAQDGARESPRLIAYIVTKRETWNCEDLRNYLKDKLPEYMVPAGFVKLQKFPLTPHGKVDLKALPTPETSRIGLDQDYIPPRTEIERTIAAIWKEVLGISEIGIGDNFFDRGGNSLLAVRMAERLRDKLPVKVSVVDIFKHPTISAQAAFVRPIQNEQQFFQPILERVRLRKQAIDL